MAVVSEATELGTGVKRGLRAGVQAESFSRALVLTLRFRHKRGEVLAGMGNVREWNKKIPTPKIGEGGR